MSQELNHNDVDRLLAELSSYSRSGLPVPEGLRQLSASLGPGALKLLADHVAGAMERGEGMSDAMKSAPVRLPAEWVALVQCGEISGDMSGILEFSVEHSRRLRNHRMSFVTALIYPLILLAVLIVSSYLILTVFVPKFKDIYNQLGAELPTLTQFVVDASWALTRPWGVVLLLTLLVLVLLPVFSKDWRERYYRVVCKLPGFNSLVALSDTALMMKYLERTLSRGVPMASALAAASLAVMNARIRIALQQMSRAAEQGNKVGPYLPLEIPATAAWLFRQGENNGDLPASCRGISRYCEDRFDRISRRTLTIFEVSMLFLVAIATGVVLISLYLPLFNIPKIVGR
ncbi:MAG: type II secretion system F family protein [Candidatus Sumerlaeaceae bacterium]|nr:type II secretion system F family protein [Candidatus Sumerlaeaceae bacterium]